MIWNYSLEEIMCGYQETEEVFCCTMCKERYEKGRIYSVDEALYDAFGAIKHHVIDVHDGVLTVLLNQESSMIGLSDIQIRLLQNIAAGKSDKEIGTELGIAQSTVRNHRFKLREKEKQAKLFLVLMKLIAQETEKSISRSDTGTIEDIHATAKMVDDRYSISDVEKNKTIMTYMDEHGALKQFPAREKKKIIILSEIMKNFKQDVVYTETEVNRILKRIYEKDFPSLRRALIEYGFMDRSADCSTYRVRALA